MESPLERGIRYKVRTPVYEGPIDLLLDLIERAELDITALSLAMVTDQYLDYIHGLEQKDPNELSGFLVIAARLLQIKSEALLPRPVVREPGEEDVGHALVDQLRLYKRFKEIGAWLDIRQQAGWRTYLRIAPPPKIEPKLDPSSLTVEALLSAAQSVFARLPEKEPLASVIAAPRVTIREKIDLIAKALRGIEAASFRSLFGENPSRLEIVVTFLALLELVKRFRVQASQASLFSDIRMERLQEWGEEEQIDLEFE